MASPIIQPAGAGMHNIFTQLELWESKDKGLSMINIRFDDDTLWKSFLQLSLFNQLDIVKKAWSATIHKASESDKAPSLENIYTSETSSIVQVQLDTKGLQITPPATPRTALSGALLARTILAFYHLESGQKALDLGLAEEVRSLINQNVIRIKVLCNANRWHIGLQYKRNSLSAAQAGEVVEIFEQYLEEALEAVVSAIPPSPPVEEDNAGHGGLCKEPTGRPKAERCIHDLIEEQAIMRPDKEAICAYDGSLSYAGLSKVSSVLAEQLKTLGARPEQRVAILMNKSFWYSVVVLAVLKSGAAFVPLDPSHPETRLKQLVGEIEPCALITTSTLSDKAEDLGCPRLFAIDVADLTRYKTYGSSVSVPAANPDNAAYIIFTSGSTGKPKGVVIEHAALSTSAINRGVVLGLGPDSRVLQYAPHTFDVSVDEILTTMIHGGCVCVPSENDRYSIAHFMESARVTVALLTPTSARTLHPDDVPSLRTLQTGGEVLTEDVNDKWSDRVSLFNVYGPTEASVACVIGNRTGLKGAGHVLGQAVGGKLWIVDPDNVECRLSDDEIGELVISGPILAREYFRDPVRTESSFVRLQNGERVYRTGDLASMDSAGTISYHGRKDLEVKIRGQRINIAEIEIAILQCDVVHSVVVEYPRSGLCEKKLVALLRFKGSSPEAEDGLFDGAQGLTEDVHSLLLSHVSSVLTPAMIPSKWLSLPYLPQTASGKADRKQVRAWLEDMDKNTYARIFHQNGTDTPISDPLDGMVAIWLNVLKLDPQSLRLDQSFIRNGGDSIMAMEARRQAHEAGIDIDIRELLGGRALQEIGRLATTTSAVAAVSKIEDDKDEHFPLSPVQQMYFDKISDPSLGLQQRVRVEIMAKIQPDLLREALNHVTLKHRMLAARFTKHMGQWMQQALCRENVDPSSCYQIYTRAAGSLGDFCTEPMAIDNGMLLHAHLQSNDEKQILVLCLHHLVVDFVSWRVILQDLHDALVAALDGAAIRLSRPTLTFQQWCREQANYAFTLTPETVLPFAPGPVNLRFWQPSKVQALSNTYGEVVQHSFRLSSTQTTQLLEKFTTAKIHPTDVMLATFALAFKHIFTERDTPTIFIEGHGRESWHASLDVSQTVGWFTAAYPIHLPKDALLTLTTAILAASERRQSVPANGHRYWACRYLSPNGQKVFGDDSRHQEMEFVFNYAGNLVQRAPGQGLFAENVHIAEIGHPNCERFSLFDINAAIEMPSSELVVHFAFPKGIAHRERVEDLVKTYQEILATVVEQNLDLNVKPSFPLVCPADVARLFEVYGVCVERDVEAVYTPSLIQQHMLNRQSQEPRFYRVQGTWAVTKATAHLEPIGMDRLSHAWNQVVHRHSSLRTVFLYSDEEERFVAVVLHEVKPAISIIRKKTQTKGSLCRDDVLSPPHRMTLHEMDNGSVVCDLEFSHTIIDAASRKIVMQDLADAYDGKLAHRPLNSPPFWEYVRLTQSSTPSVKKEDLPRAGRVVTLPSQPTDVLSKVPEACKKNEITISSFFMTAWSTVLAKHVADGNQTVDATSSQAVAFDYVLSDRSADIPSIGNAVGPYIRLPTCETHVKKGVPLTKIARDLHAQCTFQSLSQLTQGGSSLELPSKITALQKYSTLVNIRSSSSDSLNVVSGSGNVKWIMQGFNDPWDYDLVFAVNMHPGKVEGWTVEYVDGVVEHYVAEEIARDLIDVVEPGQDLPAIRQTTTNKSGSMLSLKLPFSLPVWALLLLLVLLYIFYIVTTRLLLSPIRHIPGPTLAALSFWPEFYFDVIQRGQYFRRIDKMHQKYGTIVRINPFEIHIQDPSFYPVLYTGPTRRRHKWPWAARMFGNNTSAFATVRHEHHRLRRSALNPLFSRSAIQRLTPQMQHTLAQLCDRLDSFAFTGNDVDLGIALTAFAADVITEYCFGQSLGLIGKDNFGKEWIEVVNAPSELGHLVKQCPWILVACRWAPRALVRALMPGVALLYQIQEIMSAQIQPLVDRAATTAEDKAARPLTVFDSLLSSTLPQNEKTVGRLRGEGQTLIGAGTLTTGNALKMILFHVLDNPNILRKLRAEVDGALGNVNILGMPDTTHLERLPYLSACIKEGLRMSYGVTHRLQLIAEEPLICSGVTIPAGTPVGMTSIFMHDSPAVFPEPREFRPERWLETDVETVQAMNRHFVPFSKGSRMCLGMNLAYAEIYLVLAVLFRRYEIFLRGITREDIEMAHDFFDPAPREGARGLIVRLDKRDLRSE
ncbi:hypothetical protein BDW75DRAFT_245730 [Aspergillus navahoensis]